MIKSALYRDPQLLDPGLHRHKKVRALTDLSIAKDMHAVFLAGAEFADAVLAFPIVFVHTGERQPTGRAAISPVALLGLSVNENLYVQGTRWNGSYLPAFIRRFPFLSAAVRGSQTPAVFLDAAWSGFNDTEGDPLFGAQGEPAPALQRALEFLQQFDLEQQRTRQFCARVLALDILKEVVVEAALPRGATLKVEGLLAVDEDKLNALPADTLVELQRSGMLKLLQLHLASLGNMRQLVERKALRMAAASAVAAPERHRE